MEMELDWVEPGRLRPLKRTEYESLVESGAFEEERVELVRGVLVRMTPQGPAHADVVTTLGEALAELLGAKARVRQHSALALGEDSEPEPDIAVVERRSYRRGHPKTALLVVEVADSSLRTDRTVKADLYATAGIPEYWVVDLAGLRVEVMSEPSRNGYRHRKVFKGSDVLRSATLPVEIPVRTLFAPS